MYNYAGIWRYSAPIVDLVYKVDMVITRVITQGFMMITRVIKC